MITGLEHVLHMAILDFWCRRNSREAHQQVSLEVTECRGLVLVFCFLGAVTQHLGISRRSLAGVMCDMEGFLEW